MIPVQEIRVYCCIDVNLVRELSRLWDVNVMGHLARLYHLRKNNSNSNSNSLILLHSLF